MILCQILTCKNKPFHVNVPEIYLPHNGLNVSALCGLQPGHHNGFLLRVRKTLVSDQVFSRSTGQHQDNLAFHALAVCACKQGRISMLHI